MPQKRTERRTKYFQAALKSMGKTGLNGLAMARLSKNSGMAVGSWYHHFPSREALVSGIYNYCTGRATTAMLSATTGESGAGGIIRSMARALCIHWQKNPEEARFFMECESGQIIQKKARAEAWLAFEGVLTLLRTTREKGNLRDWPEHRMLGYMLGAVYGAGLMLNAANPDELAESVWQGLKARKS